MEISIVEKVLIIDAGNQRWELDQFDLQDPPVKREGYILFDFRSTRVNKGTFQIRIYPKDVTFPIHDGLDDLFVTFNSWWNLAHRKRAFDDVTEQFTDYDKIVQTYPVGVPELMVGNNQTGTLWLWNNGWQDTHIPNKLGGIYNKTPLLFDNEQTPTITNYQTILAKVYSQDPTVSLWTLQEDGNWIERKDQSAKTTYVNGLLDTIYYELAEPAKCKIVIS